MHTVKYLEKLNLPVQSVKMPNTIDGKSDGEEEEANCNMTLEGYAGISSTIVAVNSRTIPNITNLTGDADDIDALLKDEVSNNSNQQAIDISNYATLVIVEDYR